MSLLGCNAVTGLDELSFGGAGASGASGPGTTNSTGTGMPGCVEPLVPEECEAYAQALCEKRRDCFPVLVQTGTPACVASERLNCAGDIAAPDSGMTAETMVACTAARDMQSCGSFVDGYVPEPCAFNGGRSEGEPCYSTAQCASGSVCGAKTESGCGECGIVLPGLNAPCLGGSVCAAGLYCRVGNCVQYEPDQGACGDGIYQCSQTAFCMGMTCFDQQGPGAPCMDPSQCQTFAGVTCSDGSCSPPPLQAVLGQPCNMNGGSCLNSYCAPGSFVCTEVPGICEPCGLAMGMAVFCPFPLTCNGMGTCVLPPAPACDG